MGIFLQFAMDPLATKSHSPRCWAALPHSRSAWSRSCRPQRPRALSVSFLSDMAADGLPKSVEAILGSVLAYTPQTLQPVLLQLGQQASSLVTMPLQPDAVSKFLVSTSESSEGSKLTWICCDVDWESCMASSACMEGTLFMVRDLSAREIGVGCGCRV